MRRLLTIAFLLWTSVQAYSGEEEAKIAAALVLAADLGQGAVAYSSAPSSNELVLGVVLNAERGKLLILRKQALGGYAVEATSSVFDNNFGPRYYIEILLGSGARRFSIQVNSHSGCGVQVETFRLAHSGGAWRVAGYDKSEPDARTCDVNLRSREYSANLLVHRVNVVEYRSGKVAKRESRITKFAAPELALFDFSMFQNEP